MALATIAIAGQGRHVEWKRDVEGKEGMIMRNKIRDTHLMTKLRGRARGEMRKGEDK